MNASGNSFAGGGGDSLPAADRSREPDPAVLPDRPDEWSTADIGYRQRWAPGAFGGRGDICGVFRFRVVRDEWDTDAPVPSRTILEAVVFDPPRV